MLDLLLDTCLQKTQVGGGYQFYFCCFVAGKSHNGRVLLMVDWILQTSYSTKHETGPFSPDAWPIAPVWPVALRCIVRRLIDAVSVLWCAVWQLLQQTVNRQVLWRLPCHVTCQDTPTGEPLPTLSTGDETFPNLSPLPLISKLSRWRRICADLVWPEVFISPKDLQTGAGQPADTCRHLCSDLLTSCPAGSW